MRCTLLTAPLTVAFTPALAAALSAFAPALVLAFLVLDLLTAGFDLAMWAPQYARNRGQKLFNVDRLKQNCNSFALGAVHGLFRSVSGQQYARNSRIPRARKIEHLKPGVFLFQRKIAQQQVEFCLAEKTDRLARGRSRFRIVALLFQNHAICKQH